MTRTKTNVAIDETYGFPIDPTKRLFAVFFFDCDWSNVNGDPDKAGGPRQDDLTFVGVQSHVSLKRQIRDYVADRNQAIWMAPGVDLTKQLAEYDNDADKILPKFWDTRIFGGTFPKANRARTTRGAMQFEMCRTIDPVEVLDMSITRVAGVIKTEKAKDSEEEIEKLRANMGSVSIVRYGLYRGVFHFDPKDAKKLGTTNQDLALFWEALIEGFDSHRAAARAGVTLRAIYCWSYDDVRGKVQVSQLKKRVQVKKVDELTIPNSFEDYVITTDTKDLPDSVHFYTWRDGETVVFDSKSEASPQAK